MATNRNMEIEQLKKLVSKSDDQAITIQFEEKMAWESFIHSVKEDDSRFLVLDVECLLEESYLEENRVASYLPLRLNPNQAEFLNKTGLDSKLENQIKDLSELDQLRIQLAAQIEENVEVIVLVNPNGHAPNLMELLVDLEFYLPILKTLVLDNGIVPLTNSVWEVYRNWEVQMLTKMEV